MALNEVHDLGDSLSLPVPVGTVSGDPVCVGIGLPGVALEDRGQSIAGQATVKMRGTFNLSVKGVNAGGNSAVAIGDPIYFIAANTPKLSKDVTAGHFFGHALDAVVSGATTTIRVRIARTGGLV